MDFNREVTHTGYINPETLKKYHHRVPKEITVNNFIPVREETIGKQYETVNDRSIIMKVPSFMVPLIGGGVSLLVLLMYTFGEIKWDFIETFIFVLCSLLLAFFIIYYFTMPKKEHILNRVDGRITLTGFFLQKNITMRFEDVEFAYSTGGDNATGAYMLEVIRPNKWKTFDSFDLCNGSCYKDMSAITWYMDKNRPLPPGTAFDPYRQQDYERRKAEGFPSPLYPSRVKTPEATPEQQAERERYWIEQPLS